MYSMAYESSDELEISLMRRNLQLAPSVQKILSRAREVGSPGNSPPLSEKTRQTNPLAHRVGYSFLTSTNNKTKRYLSNTGKTLRQGGHGRPLYY